MEKLNTNNFSAPGQFNEYRILSSKPLKSLQYTVEQLKLKNPTKLIQ